MRDLTAGEMEQDNDIFTSQEGVSTVQLQFYFIFVILWLNWFYFLISVNAHLFSVNSCFFVRFGFFSIIFFLAYVHLF